MNVSQVNLFKFCCLLGLPTQCLAASIVILYPNSNLVYFLEGNLNLFQAVLPLPSLFCQCLHERNFVTEILWFLSYCLKLYKEMRC